MYGKLSGASACQVFRRMLCNMWVGPHVNHQHLIVLATSFPHIEQDFPGGFGGWPGEDLISGVFLKHKNMLVFKMFQGLGPKIPKYDHGD